MVIFHMNNRHYRLKNRFFNPTKPPLGALNPAPAPGLWHAVPLSAKIGASEGEKGRPVPNPCPFKPLSVSPDAGTPVPKKGGR